MKKLPFAEECNYWKSGQSSPDVWIQKAISLLRGMGGKVLGHAFAGDLAAGRSAFLIEFQLEGETFRVVWPVLPSRSRNEKAAQIQAATMLYHDIKARCVSARVLGGRAAFFTFLQLPDGRSAAEASTPEVAAALPAMFRLLPDSGERSR